MGSRVRCVALSACQTRDPACELVNREFTPEEKPFEFSQSDAFEDIQVPRRFIGLDICPPLRSRFLLTRAGRSTARERRISPILFNMQRCLSSKVKSPKIPHLRMSRSICRLGFGRRGP